MKPNGLSLMLPFPESVLNPNQKVHWSVKSRAAKAAREAAFYLTLEHGVQLDPTKFYQVTVIFCPPDRRSRDLDNLLASMKSAFDGMCRALGIDDKMIKPVPDWGPLVDGGGKVEVTITERIEI